MLELASGSILDSVSKNALPVAMGYVLNFVPRHMILLPQKEDAPVVFLFSAENVFFVPRPFAQSHSSAALAHLHRRSITCTYTRTCTRELPKTGPSGHVVC